MRLAPHAFIRRFLLHVLPDGFHRIRHYGFLAKADRGGKLARVRELLRVASKPQEKVDPEKARCGDPEADVVRDAFMRCPNCGGFMRRIESVATRPAAAFRCDTS